MHKFNLKSGILVIIKIVIVFSLCHAEADDIAVDHGFQFAQQQLRNTIAEVSSPSRHPKRTVSSGKWEAKARGDWTCGFFSGCLWRMYEQTGDEEWREDAQRWTDDLESQKLNASNHDVGFRIMSSFGNGYRLTGRDDYKDVVLTAAETLASRYDDDVGCIRSWNAGNYLVIIDNMMNLELLFWASKNGGSQRLYDIAVSHAEKTIEHHVRPDGSTYHVVDFNNDGTVRRKYTHQGYNNESTWSRGQAWGLYGFTMTYRETGDSQFLNAAIGLADYFVDNLPEDFVPYSDFEAPGIPNVSKDSSAAAIACSGLLELDRYVDNRKYRIAALNILTSLTSSNYLSEGTKYSSILRRGCERYGDVEKGLIYGDYYFLEAMLRWDNITSVEPGGKQFATWGKLKRVVLLQNYPNPSNPETWIPYQLMADSEIAIRIYSVTGEMIRRFDLGYKSAGLYANRDRAAYWDGRNEQGEEIASGVYFYSIHADDVADVRKLTILR